MNPKTNWQPTNHYYDCDNPPKYDLMNDQAMRLAFADMQSEFNIVHPVDTNI